MRKTLRSLTRQDCLFIASICAMLATMTVAAVSSAQSVAAPGATPGATIETVQVTYGALGAIVIAAVTIASAVIGCVAWVLGALNRIDTFVQVQAEGCKLKHAAHEAAQAASRKWQDEADTLFDRYFSRDAPSTPGRKY